MRLSGALSNQSRLLALHKANQARSKLTIDHARMSSRPRPRPKQGAIQEAILTALRNEGTDLRAAEVRLGAESQLGRNISADTVSSFLSVACRSNRWPVQRVSPGRYRYVDV